MPSAFLFSVMRLGQPLTTVASKLSTCDQFREACMLMSSVNLGTTWMLTLTSV
jgi:hypothetical protein